MNNNARLLRVRLLALVFALVLTPIHTITWWLNKESLLVPELNPRSWTVLSVLGRYWLAATALGIVLLLGTALLLNTVKNYRRWRLMLGFWFGFSGVVATFVLTTVGRPSTFVDHSLAQIIAWVVITLLTAILPSLMSLFAFLFWMGLSFVLSR